MFLAFIIGIIIGALLLRFYPSVKTAVGREVLDDVKTDMDIGFWPSVWRCFFEWLPFLLLIFVFGLSIAGLAVVPVFVLFKGIHYGITAGYLYNVFSFNGIVYVLILIIPPTIIAAFGMFFSAEISFRLRFFSPLRAGIFGCPRKEWGIGPSGCNPPWPPSRGGNLRPRNQE
jgi:stage II sporulation protein M